MEVLDAVFMASMGVLVMFFAGEALVEWWDARDHRTPTSRLTHQ